MVFSDRLPLKRGSIHMTFSMTGQGSIHMTFSMTGQERGDCLIEVTTWAGLTVNYLLILGMI